MNYTFSTRTISGITLGQVTSEYISSPILFVIGTTTYFGTIATVTAGTDTSVTLENTETLPTADGTVTSIELPEPIDTATAYSTHDDILSLISTYDLAGLTQDKIQTFTCAGTVTNGSDVQFNAVISNQIENYTTGTKIGKAQMAGIEGSQVTVSMYANQLTMPNWDLIDTIIADVDKLIDSTCGQVYVVPFTLNQVPVIPEMINRISKTLTAYRCFARRFTIMEMPKMWADYKKEMTGYLTQIAEQKMGLDADIVSPNALTSEIKESHTRIDKHYFDGY